MTRQQASGETTVGLFTKEAFEALSLEWVRVGWSLKYYHTFTWFGLPVLQLPEDLLRLQEVIYAVRPAVIVETGVFLGGSLLFHASLLAAMGGGKVIGIDREIQPHIREALCSHPLAPRISLLEGNSTDPAIVSQVRSLTEGAGPVLVILDSDHTREHVARELESLCAAGDQGIVYRRDRRHHERSVRRATRAAGLEERQPFRGRECVCGAPSRVPAAAAAVALARQSADGKRHVLAGRLARSAWNRRINVRRWR